MLSLVLLLFGSMASTLMISFVSSWKFSLGFLAFLPIVAVLNVSKIRMYRTTTIEEQESLEWAGKVCLSAVTVENIPSPREIIPPV